MLKSLRALFGKPSREDPAKKPATAAPAKPAPPGKNYGSVSVVPGNECCSAAKDIVGKRFLFREGLRLPLADCTTQTHCSCKFKKASDRRDGDRREPGISETGRWFAGPENRKRGGRRSGKD